MPSDHNIPEEYMDNDFDFGFTAADELDLILEMNSTCEGSVAVKDQYDQLLQAKMDEIERVTLPLLLNLKKNKAKDYLYWPGSEREAKCDLQIQKLLNITRNV